MGMLERSVAVRRAGGKRGRSVSRGLWRMIRFMNGCGGVSIFCGPMKMKY